MNKKGEKTKTSPKAIFKRITWLQQFFTELQRDKTLRSSEILEAFLSVTDKKSFEASKKQIRKQQAPKTVSEMRHLDGKFDNEISQHKLRLSKRIAAYIQNSPALYQQAMANIDTTFKAMSLLSDCFVKNAESFRRLAAIHADVEVRWKLFISAPNWLTCSMNCRIVVRE